MGSSTATGQLLTFHAGELFGCVDIEGSRVDRLAVVDVVTEMTNMPSVGGKNKASCFLYKKESQGKPCRQRSVDDSRHHQGHNVINANFVLSVRTGNNQESIATNVPYDLEEAKL